MEKVKYRIYLDYEKEEKWINEMAANGWHLVKFTMGRFKFEKGEPGAFIYRNEFLSGISKVEKQEYFEILKDSGASVVHESGNWVYLKREADKGPFEIFSDSKSKIDYLNRIISVFLVIFLANISLGIWNISFLSTVSDMGIVNRNLGIFNILAAIIIAIPINKILRRKNQLKREGQFFE